jgi:hypothetical protein
MWFGEKKVVFDWFRWLPSSIRARTNVFVGEERETMARVVSVLVYLVSLVVLIGCGGEEGGY